VVWITVGFRHSPREKIFSAVIDDVEVKKLKDLSRRDIEHDNPEFRRLEDERSSSSRSTAGRSWKEDAVTVIRFSQIHRVAQAPHRQRGDATPQLMAEYAFLTTWLLESPRQPVWEAIHDQARWPEWWRGVEEAEELRPGSDGDDVGTVGADGLEEPAALPGRVRGDDDPGRAPAPAGRGTPLASWRGSAAGASTSRRGSPPSSTSGT